MNEIKKYVWMIVDEKGKPVYLEDSLFISNTKKYALDILDAMYWLENHRAYKIKKAYLKIILPFFLIVLITFSLLVRLHAEPQTLIVTTTCYSHNEPTNTTSTGKRVNVRYVAVSRKLEKIFPMHSLIKACGKVYQVEDRMSAKWKGYRLDIFRETKRECSAWGIKKCVVEGVR